MYISSFKLLLFTIGIFQGVSSSPLPLDFVSSARTGGRLQSRQHASFLGSQLANSNAPGLDQITTKQLSENYNINHTNISDIPFPLSLHLHPNEEVASQIAVGNALQRIVLACQASSNGLLEELALDPQDTKAIDGLTPRQKQILAYALVFSANHESGPTTAVAPVPTTASSSGTLFNATSTTLNSSTNALPHPPNVVAINVTAAASFNTSISTQQTSTKDLTASHTGSGLRKRLTYFQAILSGLLGGITFAIGGLTTQQLINKYYGPTSSLRRRDVTVPGLFLADLD